MGRRKGWASSVTGRPVMRSPGRPPAGRREHGVRFWAAIALGASSVDAAAQAGVSGVVGVRWFREGGGMPPSAIRAPLSGRYLSFAEREEIALLRARKCGGAGDRASARPLLLDDLQGAAPERRDPQWSSGVSGVDCAVACGSAGPSSEGCEACCEC